jgi:hypothetical protein
LRVEDPQWEAPCRETPINRSQNIEVNASRVVDETLAAPTKTVLLISPQLACLIHQQAAADKTLPPPPPPRLTLAWRVKCNILQSSIRPHNEKLESRVKRYLKLSKSHIQRPVFGRFSYYMYVSLP